MYQKPDNDKIPVYIRFDSIWQPEIGAKKAEKTSNHTHTPHTYKHVHALHRQKCIS